MKEFDVKIKKMGPSLIEEEDTVDTLEGFLNSLNDCDEERFTTMKAHIDTLHPPIQHPTGQHIRCIRVLGTERSLR